MTRLAFAVALLAALALPAVAQRLPLPKTGQRPSGYASEAAYCVPIPTMVTLTGLSGQRSRTWKANERRGCRPK
jgi:hypothetical protein